MIDEHKIRKELETFREENRKAIECIEKLKEMIGAIQEVHMALLETFKSSNGIGEIALDQAWERNRI